MGKEVSARLLGGKNVYLRGALVVVTVAGGNTVIIAPR
jgi:hypothetical protein